MKRIMPVLFAATLTFLFAIPAFAQSQPTNPTDSVTTTTENAETASPKTTSTFAVMSFGNQIRKEDGDKLLKIGLPVTVSVPSVGQGFYNVRVALSHHIGEGQPTLTENFATILLDERGNGTFELSLSVPYELVGRAWLTQYRFEGSLAGQEGAGKKIAGVIQFSNNGARIVGQPVAF